MGKIKDRNGIDLTEAEDITKRWQEYTELYKKDFYDPDNQDGVITHLEPNILECEVIVEVMNRFKGLELVNRVPEELRTEVCNIV